MTPEWKDATNYRQGERGKIEPTSWEMRFDGARIWISKGHRYYPDKWIVNCCEVGIEEQEICPVSDTTPLSAVQESALKFVAVVMKQKAEKLHQLSLDIQERADQ
jgi:hypothetical protein